MYSLRYLRVPGGRQGMRNFPYPLCPEFFYQSHIGLLQDHGCNSGPRSIFVLSPEISTKPGLKNTNFLRRPGNESDLMPSPGIPAIRHVPKKES